jgi:hypothetical protein
LKAKFARYKYKNSNVNRTEFIISMSIEMKRYEKFVMQKKAECGLSSVWIIHLSRLTRRLNCKKKIKALLMPSKLITGWQFIDDILWQLARNSWAFALLLKIKEQGIDEISMYVEGSTLALSYYFIPYIVNIFNSLLIKTFWLMRITNKM